MPQHVRLGAALLALALASVAVPADAAPERDVRWGPPIDVQVLSVTDFHGGDKLPSQDTDIYLSDGTVHEAGDAAYLASELDRLSVRHRRGNTFRVLNGDNLTGYNYPDKSLANEPAMEVLDALDFEFSSVGNHDLDWRIDYLLDHTSEQACPGGPRADDCFVDSTGALSAGADFEYLSANVHWRESGDLVFQPYAIREVEGRRGTRSKVGFIGITLQGSDRHAMSYNDALETTDAVTAVNHYAAELQAQGVEAIVVLDHEGLRQDSKAVDACENPRDLAWTVATQAVPAVDAVIAGHTHGLASCTVTDPAGDPRPLAIGGSYGNVIAELNLSIDPQTDDVIRDRSGFTMHPVTQDGRPDPEVRAIKDHWAGFAAERATTPVAWTEGSATLQRDASGESTLGNLVADAMLRSAATEPQLEADLGMVATRDHSGPGWNSEIHGDLPATPHADAPAGLSAFTHQAAFEVFGHEHKVVTATRTGAQLEAALEQQWVVGPDGSETFYPIAVSADVRYTWQASAPVGDRVDPASITIGGAPLDLGRTYRVAGPVDTFNGSSDFPALRTTELMRTHPHTDHITFVSYLRELGSVTLPEQDRVQVTP
ncbi:bifunctional metallophosphatase/5'-nucleotidase [Auraticoccus monumenti]|uniref:5'-nucleotidase n=1 Tax=Auraticoccus monumenti TaxID=675864 RepID=A0A1G7A0U7_9ACTN|nr:bifunctional UDP-sugar hydrolase/5'-nucleotidase [Auraticoccus monumenti]SDE08439.1 5'-nucleotidase [Auraticoccus monumenti]